MAIDIKIMELLTSKICHDLISPIGAINNGMEFVEDMGAEAGKDVFDLIGFSAAQASAKLQAYRIAYGAGGADTSIKPEDVHKTIQALIEKDGKLKQNWNPHDSIGPADRPNGFAKIFVCGFLAIMDCLPKGGTISVKSVENGALIIEGQGENAAPRNEMESCLALSFEKGKLEPKHIHAYVTGLIAEEYDFKLAFSRPSEGLVSLKVSFS